MKFLKGLALSLLGFLLFLSLSIFGLALMLNNTLLNPDFVVSELNKLDVSSLARDMISAQIPLEQIPLEGEFITEILDDTIADLEPWIREQVNTVTLLQLRLSIREKSKPERDNFSGASKGKRERKPA